MCNRKYENIEYYNKYNNCIVFYNVPVVVTNGLCTKRIVKICTPCDLHKLKKCAKTIYYNVVPILNPVRLHRNINLTINEDF